MHLFVVCSLLVSPVRMSALCKQRTHFSWLLWASLHLAQSLVPVRLLVNTGYMGM